MNLKNHFLFCNANIFLVLLSFFIVWSPSVNENYSSPQAKIAHSVEPEAAPTKEKCALSQSKLVVASHRSLFLTLKNAGFLKSDILLIMRVIPKKSISVGQKITVTHKGPELISVKMPLNFSTELEVLKNQKGIFLCQKRVAPIEKVFARIESKVGNNMLASLTKKGVPHHIAIGLVRSLSKMGTSWRSLVRPATTVTLLYKHLKNTHTKAIIFDQVCLVRFQTGKSQGMYYAYKAHGTSSVRFYSHAGNMCGQEQFCKPVRAGRLSSGFGVRYHPIHHVRKMHNGIDFAAPSGTPVVAAASGVIEKMGRKGGYGNLIKIRHSNGFCSVYGHLKGYASGLRPGRYVEQGRVIGYVGATGHATGPHLHFEIRSGDRPINPMQKALCGQQLTGKQKLAFQSYVRSLWRVCESLSN